MGHKSFGEIHLYLFCLFVLLGSGFVLQAVAQTDIEYEGKKLDLEPIDNIHKSMQKNKKKQKYYGDSEKMSESEKKQVVRKLMKNKIEDYIKVERSPAGRRINRFEKRSAKDLSIGTGPAKQSFKFRMKAAQTKASVRYKGLVDLDFSYRVYNQNFRIDYSEPIARDKELFFEHLEAPEERLDQLGVRWVF